jgi:opacity protein-like surface antigen
MQAEGEPAAPSGRGSRSRPWIGLIATLTLTGPCGSAHAQAWYLAASLGNAWIADDRVTLSDAGGRVVFLPVPYESRSLESPLYYGVRIARDTPVWWRFGFDVEFIHAKAYADVTRAVGETMAGTRAPMSEVVEAFAMSHGMNLLVGNVVLRYPLGARPSAGRLRLTARAGLGVAVPHAESTVRGDRREGYEVAGAAYQAGAGIEWVAARRVLVLADYRWTYASPQVTVAGGTAKTTIRMNHLTVGAGLRF